jgi:hypothetical protein
MIQRAVDNPFMAAPADVLAIQQRFGNRAVQQLVADRSISGPIAPTHAIQRAEDTATGIAKQKAIGRYTRKVGNVFNKWKKLKPEGRANEIGKHVNAELKKADSYPCDITLKDLGTTSGEFNFQTWALDLGEAALSNNDPTEAEMADMADTVYHEARHSEQWYRIARVRAGEGKTADEIASGLFIPAKVAKKAAKNPLKPSSGMFTTKKGRERQQAKIAEGKDWEKSIYGAGATHRNEVLGDIQNRYAEYKALPEEKDAWAVGGAVTTAFKNRKKKK